MYLSLEGFINTHGTKTFYEAARFAADIQSAFEDRVRLGAEWLDETQPGWEDMIDLSGLNLASASHCICGQLWMQEAFQANSKWYETDGEDGIRVDDGFGLVVETILMENEPYEFGFNIDIYNDFGLKVNPETDLFSAYVWEELTYEWKHVIEKRRANKGTI